MNDEKSLLIRLDLMIVFVCLGLITQEYYYDECNPY